MNVDRTRPLPGMFVALTLFAGPCLLAGVLGLVAGRQFPMLAPPAVAWSFVAVGAMLDMAALAVLISWVRESRRAK